ncbi:YaaR family protein [Halalkalibacillus halophilus]|uniref:YaaR family protein n=1 Tax=Halalkalibacillus halophilus TaxID=392827 RepID=UPI00041ED0B9|nr:YaaR family protein [Halalkalibacillus halophilus]
MKITKELRTQLETSQKKSKPTRGTVPSFQKMVGSETQKMQESEMNRLLQDLTQQGEKVAKFRSFQDLGKYKRMVRQFIEEAVNYGLDLEQMRSWDMNGGNRTLSLVKKIDDKLVQLTDDMIDQEKSSLDILDVIGEIKGMLMNIYA